MAAVAITLPLSISASLVVPPPMLLAQGLDVFDAAAGGAWLHGRAARQGPARGLVASDVTDGLPAALMALASSGRPGGSQGRA
jgi:hypothetical protein